MKETPEKSSGEVVLHESPDDELSPESNMQKVHIASFAKPLTMCSLDAVISVGYRVNSARGTQL